MERVYFTTYKGKKILVEDFSMGKATPEYFENLKKAQGIIAGQPQKSVLAHRCLGR